MHYSDTGENRRYGVGKLVHLWKIDLVVARWETRACKVLGGLGFLTYLERVTSSLVIFLGFGMIISIL